MGGWKRWHESNKIRESLAKCPKMITRPNLNDRGWTDSLIRRFLPTEDGTLPNPMFIDGGPMKLYSQERVERIEASQEFLHAKRESQQRKLSAQKAVSTKLAKMKEYLANLIVKVPEMEREALIAAASRNFCSLELPQGIDLSVERKCVNYLRHCCTNYEAELARIAGKAGSKDAYVEIKLMVLDEIEFTYDWLAEECDRQRTKTLKEWLEVF